MDYSFKEFERHMMDYPKFRHNRHISQSGMIELQVFDYMSRLYDDRGEAMEKAKRFVLINEYLASNLATVTAESDGLIQQGQDDGVLHVHMRLWRAVHELMSAGDYRAEPHPRDVIRTALGYEDEPPVFGTSN